MKQIRARQLGITALIFVSVFLIGAQNAMAVSFDYYSHVENPPISRHKPSLDYIKKELKGRFGEVYLGLPVGLAKKDLNTLQSSISVKGIKSQPVEFIIEKYELISENGMISLYPRNFDREIKQGKITAAQALAKLHESVYETNYTGKYKNEGPNFTNFTFSVKNYKEPFKQLTLNIRVKIMYQGQEEIIEDSIPLYRGRFTFTMFEYMKDRFYE